MRVLFALLVALVFVPAAAGSTIWFASTAALDTPRVVQVGLDGGGAKTVTQGSIVAQSADGRIATADGSSLLVDGKVVATIRRQGIWEAVFSPDGTTVAFTTWDGATCHPTDVFGCATPRLWLVGSDGSRLHELDNRGAYPRFSPDGKRLAFLGAFHTNGPVSTATVVDLATGHRTTFGGWRAGEGAPVWAFDSNRFAFHSRVSRLLIATVQPRRVQRADIYGYRVPVAFSPDGKRLLTADSRGLYIGTRHLPATIAGPDADAAWTADNWIVYVGPDPLVRVPGNDALYRMRPDGTHSTVLRRFVPSTQISLVRVGDGTVTFNQKSTRVGVATIKAVDPVSGLARVVRAEDANDSSPTVSPDGVLAYARVALPAGASCLVVGAQCVARDVQGPTWSPDGREIAYLTPGGARYSFDVSILDVATGATRAVGTIPGAGSGLPTWSPDGTTIIVECAAGAADESLFMLDVTTGAWRALPVLGIAAAYSPDGARLAVVTPKRHLELYDLATGAVTDLAEDADGTRPAWSPDGTQIAYASQTGGLHVIGVDGSGDHQVASGVSDDAIAWSR